MKPSVIFGQLFGFLTRLRIRHKLGIAFVSFSILPVMVVGGYSWYVGSRFMRDSAINELSNVTNTIKRRLIDFGDAIDSDLNTLLMFFQPRKGSEPGRPVDPTDLGVLEDRALLLMYTRQHYARLTYITELNIEGLLHLHRDPYNRSRITSLPSNYSWYYYKLLIDDLAQGRSRMSPVEYLDLASGQPFAAFTFAIPDRDESGDLRGILIADVFADYVFAIIESALIGREYYTAGLIDRDGASEKVDTKIHTTKEGAATKVLTGDPAFTYPIPTTNTYFIIANDLQQEAVNDRSKKIRTRVGLISENNASSVDINKIPDQLTPWLPKGDVIGVPGYLGRIDDGDQDLTGTPAS